MAVLLTFTLQGIIPAQLFAAPRPTTVGHFKNLGVYMKEGGLFRGLGRWLREDWEMTAGDTRAITRATGRAVSLPFRGIGQWIDRLKQKKRQELVAELKLEQMNHDLAAILQKMDRPMILQLAGRIDDDRISDSDVEAIRRSLIARLEDNLEGIRHDLQRIDDVGLAQELEKAKQVWTELEQAAEGQTSGSTPLNRRELAKDALRALGGTVASAVLMVAFVGLGSTLRDFATPNNPADGIGSMFDLIGLIVVGPTLLFGLGVTGIGAVSSLAPLGEFLKRLALGHYRTPAPPKP